MIKYYHDDFLSYNLFFSIKYKSGIEKTKCSIKTLVLLIENVFLKLSPKGKNSRSSRQIDSFV